MELLLSLITGVLSLYLAFTNVLAEQIMHLLPATERTTVTTTQPTSDSTESEPTAELTNVNSEYEYGGAIPRILIENASYQAATVIESFSATSTDVAPDAAIANIYCTYHIGDNESRITTGTGWFVHRNGVIMTNAHVAQTLLLSELIGDSTCIVRVGSPAHPAYVADLLYVSPAWLRAHAGIVNEAKPQGTGERDYALLYVSASTDGSPLPTEFPALSFDTTLLPRSTQGAEVTVAGYPATSLIENGSDGKLYASTATTTITELMTFGSNYADLFSIAGTPVGAEGASGGPVIDSSGNVIGVVSTRGDDAQFGKGSLRALTISYIDRTLEEETGFNLENNLTGDLPYRAALYKKNIVPFLKTFQSWELE